MVLAINNCFFRPIYEGRCPLKESSFKVMKNPKWFMMKANQVSITSSKETEAYKKYKPNKNFDIILSDAVVASTDPDLFEKKNLKKFKKIKDLVKRNYWSGDCHNYLLLANGGIDIVLEENLSCYDIFPLVPILKSQKLLISDWEGKNIDFKFDKNIKYQVLASVNSNIHNELIKIL